MRKLQFNPKVNRMMGRVTTILVYIIFFLVAVSLGLSYVAQKPIVLEPGSVRGGWTILGAVAFVTVAEIVLWIRGRRTTKAE